MPSGDADQRLLESILVERCDGDWLMKDVFKLLCFSGDGVFDVHSECPTLLFNPSYQFSITGFLRNKRDAASGSKPINNRAIARYVVHNYTPIRCRVFFIEVYNETKAFVCASSHEVDRGPTSTLTRNFGDVSSIT